MHFTRLRLVGFKSFVEPTDLDIEPGLTGIVGPNGCGKSNLVEALRWVMGESSHKNMRASEMDDVIFQGSLNRPARNTAEVALGLDNTDGSAPGPDSAAAAIEVTRRIEREAGSAYRINGRDVRARDVQLLFADASTGAHSPAIVGQGRIGELIAAKPVDRRMLLEEAAGIAGLHNRRHEAELRLSAAEQNLARLEDVITEIGQQFDALKRQARQATRYRNLSTEIRKAEAAVLHLRFAAATSALAAAEAAHARALAAVNDRAAEQASAARIAAEAAAAQPALREAAARAGATLQRLAHAHDSLDAEDKRVTTRLGELANLLRQFNDDIGREQRMLTEHGEILARLGGEAESLAAADAGLAERRMDAARRRDATAATLAKSEAHMGELTDSHAELVARRRGLERAVVEAEARQRRIADEIAAINAKRARADDATAGAAIEKLRRSLGASETLTETCETAAAAADAEFTLAQAATAAARDELNANEQALGRLETEAATLAALAASSGDAALVDAVQVAPGFEAALGAAFGEDLDASADEAAPAHWRALTPLPEDVPLPEAAVPLARYVQAPAVLSRRLAQTGIVERETGSALQASLKPGQRLVSREGDLWRWDGYVAAAHAPGSAVQRLATRNRLAELKATLVAAQQATEVKRAEFSAASRRNADAALADRAARDAVTAARRELDQRRRDLVQAEAAAAEQHARRRALDEALSRLTRDRDEAEAARGEAAAALAAADDPAAIAAELAAARAAVDIERTRSAEARAAAEGILRESEMRQARLVAIEGERTGWLERMQSAEDHAATLDRRRREADEERSRLAPEKPRIEAQRRALLTELSTAEAARAAATDALATGEATLAHADRGARMATDALAEARVERGRAEERVAAAKDRLREIEHHIEESMQCAPSNLAAIAELKADVASPSLGDFEARLERYRDERERLGAVNLRADEEATELAARRDGLVRERDDLVGAIERLRQGIASLNREGRERLAAAFVTVNAHFTRLFTDLFGGGTAELQFTDSEDPLAAGLEIIARPPGKKPQVMTLLSGGEQALTALALIFAVFLTNPAPICVLDEVDAPLDDANVDRFCDLLQSMAGQTATRFLVITHNPITMSRMSRLYGVTMAERGVSQLVSVDLETAERFREAG